MRASRKNHVLRGRAIAGTHVVVLAWDFVGGADAAHEGLLGFAIQREQRKNGKPIERYFLTGIKRFREKDRGLPPGTPVSTAEHPIQSFQWADYTAITGRSYRYTILPVYGVPKLVELDRDAGLVLEVDTEREHLLDPDAKNDETVHDVYFNRGVIGSQAYARRFGNRKPNANDPESEPIVWLSRGLFEALLAFIALAKDGDELHAAFYEFHYQPVANAFAKAIEAGAKVQIVFDDESSYKTENREVIRTAKLDQNKAVIPRTVTEGIRHNKFIVLSRAGKPSAVWTGSTNISDGGLFGHSNVGHIVWDEELASDYIAYWELLAENLTPTKLRPKAKELSPLPEGKAPKGCTPLFSARDAKDNNDTLAWYAQLMASAKEIVCWTVAFNIDPVFMDVLAADTDVLRYVVKDDDLAKGVVISRDRDVLFAAGGRLPSGALANFLAERSNPLNRNLYIHDKFLLVDPLGRDPVVVTGSANFSLPSQRSNDENMLVIRGDLRVADIYFGEFMRIFDHHYARYVVRKLADSPRNDPEAGYLKPNTADWLPSHLDPKSPKSKRRRYFVGP